MLRPVGYKPPNPLGNATYHTRFSIVPIPFLLKLSSILFPTLVQGLQDFHLELAIFIHSAKISFLFGGCISFFYFLFFGRKISTHTPLATLLCRQPNINHSIELNTIDSLVGMGQPKLEVSTGHIRPNANACQRKEKCTTSQVCHLVEHLAGTSRVPFQSHPPCL